jgi:hypothetical protein
MLCQRPLCSGPVKLTCTLVRHTLECHMVGYGMNARVQGRSRQHTGRIGCCVVGVAPHASHLQQLASGFDVWPDGSTQGAANALIYHINAIRAGSSQSS